MHYPLPQTQYPVRLAAVGTAVPDCIVEQQLALRLMVEHYGNVLTPRGRDVLEKMLSHPSIKTRRICVDSLRDLVRLKDEDPDVRMQRFTRWSVDLSAAAVGRALQRAGIGAQDIGGLIVNTCTGYLCPGISTYLIERLGLDPAVRAYDLAGSGCGGAIPNLQLGERLAAGLPGRAVVCVSVEICSATFQMGNDISLILSNAIFGDGAAAAVLWDRPQGVLLHAAASRFAPAYRDDVRYVYQRGQLHNRLTPQLPKIIRSLVPPFIRDLLAAQGLTTKDVSHWVLHPGGDKMIDGLQQELALSDEDLAITRQTLADYGNMSSPTVLFELEQVLRKGVNPGDWISMTAFGAGLSIYGYLLRGG